MQFIKPGTKFDFVGMRRFASVISSLLVICSIALFAIIGPNWGIDFTGGNEILLQFVEPGTEDAEKPVPATNTVEIGTVRDALESLGISPDSVQQLGGQEENRFTIRIQDPRFGTEGVQTEVENALKEKYGQDWIAESKFVAEVSNKLTIRYSGGPVLVRDIQATLDGVEEAKVRDAPDENTVYIDLPALSSKITDNIKEAMGGQPLRVLSTDSVGPKVGSELRRQGFVAIASTLALILVYVAFRFDLSFAPGAVLALFHDVTIVAGVFVITQHEFNLPMIGAMLTIIGYSLNDTIVIYDRIRENMGRYRRRDLAQLINDSINETMSRTLATSTTTALGMLAFLFLGGPVIETFALAILLGVIVGTYSTIFVASPTILVMQDLRPYLEKAFAPLTGDGPEDEDGEGEENTSMTQTERRRRARQAPRGDSA